MFPQMLTSQITWSVYIAGFKDIPFLVSAKETICDVQGGAARGNRVFPILVLKLGKFI